MSRNLTDVRRFKQEPDAALSLIDPGLKWARGGNIEEAESIGTDRVVVTDDDHEIADLPLVDAAADSVNGKTAEMFIAKVKPEGMYASVLRVPRTGYRRPGTHGMPRSTPL